MGLHFYVSHITAVKIFIIPCNTLENPHYTTFINYNILKILLQEKFAVSIEFFQMMCYNYSIK